MEQPRKFGFGSEADSGDQRADVGYGSAADVVAIISVVGFGPGADVEPSVAKCQRGANSALARVPINHRLSLGCRGCLDCCVPNP
jgi:hypothetical protein